VSYRLVVRPEVDADLLKAEKWYDERQEGLGKEFLLATRQAMARLLGNPLLHRVRHRREQIRWAYPCRFPYRIIFRVIGDTVVIYAVMIDSFNRESIELPGNRVVVYFKDVVGQEYSCDYPFTGGVQWNVIIPGWNSTE